MEKTVIVNIKESEFSPEKLNVISQLKLRCRFEQFMFGDFVFNNKTVVVFINKFSKLINTLTNEQSFSSIDFLCGCGYKVHFVISDISLEDIEFFDYTRSQTTLTQAVRQLQNVFGCQFDFCESKDTAKMILKSAEKPGGQLNREGPIAIRR